MTIYRRLHQGKRAQEAGRTVCEEDVLHVRDDLCRLQVYRSYHWGVYSRAGGKGHQEERKGDGGGYARPEGSRKMSEGQQGARHVCCYAEIPMRKLCEL